MKELSIKGTVCWRGDDAYELARQQAVWNGRKPSRFPALIVKAADETDVVAAVRYANANGLKVSIRAGGHSWAGWSVRDDSLLLDLSAMRAITLDAERNIVSVNPAVKGGEELNPFLAEHGLIFPGGHCPSVGLGGFLLQGGMGWNCRGWGWAAEAIEAIDVVTADGQLLRADASQNSDWLWAARGAGPGFFGVVTRFHLKVRPLPKALTQSVYVFAKECYEPVLRWAHEMHASIADSVELVVLGVTPPETQESQVVMLALALVDSHREAVEALAPFELCPVVDQALVHVFAQPTTFAEQLAKQTEQNPDGYFYAADNAWLQGSADEVVPRMKNAFVNLPNATSYTLWFSMAPLRPLPDMALSLQADIYFACYVNWLDAAVETSNREWLAARMKELEPVTIGQYLGDSDFSTRRVKFMAEENYARLEQLREQYDPGRLFHRYLVPNGATLNQNHWE